MFCFDCDTPLWTFLKTSLKMSDNANTKKKEKAHGDLMVVLLFVSSLHVHTVLCVVLEFYLKVM